MQAFDFDTHIVYFGITERKKPRKSFNKISLISQNAPQTHNQHIHIYIIGKTKAILFSCKLKENHTQIILRVIFFDIHSEIVVLCISIELISNPLKIFMSFFGITWWLSSHFEYFECNLELIIDWYIVKISFTLDFILQKQAYQKRVISPKNIFNLKCWTDSRFNYEIKKPIIQFGYFVRIQIPFASISVSMFKYIYRTYECMRNFYGYAVAHDDNIFQI